MKLSQLITEEEYHQRGHIDSPGNFQIMDTSNSPTFNPDPEITSIHYNSRTVKYGGLFVAIKGHTSDGHKFINDALNRGAAAVFVQKPVGSLHLNIEGHPEHKNGAAIVETSDSRKALATLAKRFYGHPSEKLTVIGITGTNGKTTVAYLIESILKKAGIKTGVIGTINYRYSDKTFDNPVTTPESLDLQRILDEMQMNGITHVIMEVSSHAIELGRIIGCDFDLCLFTNLTQDHLDFHKNMAAYWETKKKLFTEHLARSRKKEHAVAVVNCDSPKGKELIQSLSVKYISCGMEMDNMVRAQIDAHDMSGIQGKIMLPADAIPFQSVLVGNHNIENILCAAGVGHALHISTGAIQAGIENVKNIPGRLERVSHTENVFVFVDYAHTPDALKNVLTALNSLKKKSSQTICVFGCGGDRDREKRPQMGEIAARYSDMVIVTSDNPRTEDPNDIIEQICLGVHKGISGKNGKTDRKQPAAKKTVIVEPDRRKAIRNGLKAAGPNDIILIAGKGHEDYQIIGTKKIHFDDREEVTKVLAEAPL